MTGWGGGSSEPGGTSSPERRTRSGSSSLITTRSKRGRSCWRMLVKPSAPHHRVPPRMRLIVARCEVRYCGRLNALLPEALRLIMLKADGSVLIHADAGGYKALNWMTPPTGIEETDRPIVVRKRGQSQPDRLEITIAEILSDVNHDMGTPDE